MHGTIDDARPREGAPGSPDSPCTSLRHLPVELIDHLLSHITEPADLLSLALCNHALYNIIAPAHLAWHSISIPSQHASLVAHLCSHRRTAQLVRRLIITDTWTTTGHGHRLCTHADAGSCTSEETKEVDYVLWECCAEELTNLRSLVLHVRDLGKWKSFLAIVRQSSPDLRSIALQQYLGFMYRYRIEPQPAISTLDEIRNVEELDWYSALGQGAGPGLSLQDPLTSSGPEIFSSLVRCLALNSATLRAIKINISSDDTASTAFWTLRFPRLRECKVLNVHGSRHVGEFLAAHAGLEVFHLHTSSALPFCLPSNALRNAKDVDLRYYGHPELYIQLVSPLPDGRYRPLERLAICAQALGRRCNDDNDPALDVFCAHLKHITTLRALTWIDLSHSLSESRFLRPVTEAARGVEEVVFAWNLPTGPSMGILCDALSTLPKLHTIRCPASTLVPYEISCQAELLRRACPGLRRLNECVRLEGDGVWKVIKDGRQFWERVTL